MILHAAIAGAQVLVLVLVLALVCAHSFAGPVPPVDNVGWETKERLVWNPLLAFPDALYDVLRSDTSDLSTPICIKADEPGIETTDPEIPLPACLNTSLPVQPGPGPVDVFG